MKKTTLFEETSYWCSINMAGGLVKQRFEKTEGKSRKSLSFSLLEKRRETLKSLKKRSKAFANETNELGPAWYKIRNTSNSRTRRKSLSYSDPETKIKDLKACWATRKSFTLRKRSKQMLFSLASEGKSCWPEIQKPQEMNKRIMTSQC